MEIAENCLVRKTRTWDHYPLENTHPPKGTLMNIFCAPAFPIAIQAVAELDSVGET